MSVQIPNGQNPEQNVITGGQPSGVQFAAFRDAAGDECRVVNLRGSGEPGVAEQSALMKQLGIDYVHLPVSGPGDLSFETAAALKAALEYEGPVMVHCASGNRVGAVRALAAFQFEDQGVEEALAIGRRWGLTRMEPMIAGMLQTAARDR